MFYSEIYFVLFYLQLRFPLMFIPMALGMLADANVAVARITRFLLAGELSSETLTSEKGHITIDEPFKIEDGTTTSSATYTDEVIAMRHATFRWEAISHVDVNNVTISAIDTVSDGHSSKSYTAVPNASPGIHNYGGVYFN